MNTKKTDQTAEMCCLVFITEINMQYNRFSHNKAKKTILILDSL